jgi:histidinol phosphate phosphatase HisJ family
MSIDFSALGKSNLHTHTTFCDGKNTAAEMAAAAFEAGYDTLGFSGHSPCFPGVLSSNWWGMKPEDMPAYIAEVRRLGAEYDGRMKIFCGIEWDAFSEVPPDELDYVIGSVHGLEKDGEIYWIDISRERFEEMLAAFGSAEELVNRYYKEYKKLVNKQFVDIAGHIDLIALWNNDSRYFDEKADWYLSAAFDAADAIIASGKIIEINSNAVFKGLRDEPYPASSILEYIKRNGGKTIETLDAHGIERFK